MKAQLARQEINNQVVLYLWLKNEGDSKLQPDWFSCCSELPFTHKYKCFEPTALNGLVVIFLNGRNKFHPYKISRAYCSYVQIPKG